jgi:hypothetical protein
MGGGYWSAPFYHEAYLREPSPIETERVLEVGRNRLHHVCRMLKQKSPQNHQQ